MAGQVARCSLLWDTVIYSDTQLSCLRFCFVWNGLHAWWCVPDCGCIHTPPLVPSMSSHAANVRDATHPKLIFQLGPHLTCDRRHRSLIPVTGFYNDSLSFARLHHTRCSVGVWYYASGIVPYAPFFGTASRPSGKRFSLAGKFVRSWERHPCRHSGTIGVSFEGVLDGWMAELPCGGPQSA